MQGLIILIQFATRYFTKTGNFFRLFRTNFSKLRKKEIVHSIRGTQGGYVFKKAKDIKLTNIFDAVDEKVKTVQCKESKKVAMESQQNFNSQSLG